MDNSRSNYLHFSANVSHDGSIFKTCPNKIIIKRRINKEPLINTIVVTLSHSRSTNFSKVTYSTVKICSSSSTIFSVGDVALVWRTRCGSYFSHIYEHIAHVIKWCSHGTKLHFSFLFSFVFDTTDTTHHVNKTKERRQQAIFCRGGNKNGHFLNRSLLHRHPACLSLLKNSFTETRRNLPPVKSHACTQPPLRRLCLGSLVGSCWPRSRRALGGSRWVLARLWTSPNPAVLGIPWWDCRLRYFGEWWLL